MVMHYMQSVNRTVAISM